MLAELREIWAIGLAAIDARDPIRAIGKIKGVHAVDADQQDMLNMVIADGFHWAGLNGCKSERQGGKRNAVTAVFVTPAFSPAPDFLPRFDFMVDALRHPSWPLVNGGGIQAGT